MTLPTSFRTLCVFSLLLSSLQARPACAATDIEFVLDVSGSMQQKLGGETQLDAAKDALAGALDEIPAGQLVAVRVYGHRVEKANKEESCKDTELVSPFKQLDKAAIVGSVRPLAAKGWTPIAYSLEQTRNDLNDVGVAREAERSIILLTDGEETCGGDPIAVLKKLRDEGFKFTVYTIGFNVDSTARKQLQEIADFSGGKYFDAKDAEQLNAVFKEATKASAVPPKAAPVAKVSRLPRAERTVKVLAPSVSLPAMEDIIVVEAGGADNPHAPIKLFNAGKGTKYGEPIRIPPDFKGEKFDLVWIPENGRRLIVAKDIVFGPEHSAFELKPEERIGMVRLSGKDLPAPKAIYAAEAGHDKATVKLFATQEAKGYGEDMAVPAGSYDLYIDSAQDSRLELVAEKVEVRPGEVSEVE